VNRGGSVWSLFALRWIGESKLVDPFEFGFHLLHCNLRTYTACLCMKIAQQRDAEHTVGSMHAYFAVDPVVNESSLRRTLKAFFAYYHDSRCQLALNKDSPETREVTPSFRRVAPAGFVAAWWR
jgi:hypothetical protein